MLSLIFFLPHSDLSILSYRNFSDNRSRDTSAFFRLRFRNTWNFRLANRVLPESTSFQRRSQPEQNFTVKYALNFLIYLTLQYIYSRSIMTSSLFLSVWKLDFRTALILTQLSHTSSSEQKFHDFAQFSSHFDYFFLFFLLCTLLHPFVSRRKNFVLRQLQRSASRFHNRESCIVNAEPWTLNPESWTVNRERESWIVNLVSG